MTLIDRDKLLQKFQDKELFNVTEKHLSLIQNATTIDAVEVVRCKDCKLRHSSEFCECREEMAYCSDGERRESEGT